MDRTKLNILRQIKDKEISSTEALLLLKGLRHRTAGIDPKPQHEKAVKGDSPYTGGIAVIGMACLFPDAVSPQQFWQNLASGKDSVKELPQARRDIQDREIGCRPEDDPFQRIRGGFLSHIDRFDPFFFNISPKQAELMDPQQRLFLQEAWHALEDAGYSPALLDGTHCGVFVGYNSVDYQETLQQRNISPDADSFIGNLAPVLAARISYVLNLKGPNVAVNTACSSSLVAVHLACESIRSGDSEMALAGGVQLMTTNRSHLYTGTTGMLSPDGKCKTFDHGADGFVPGEGIGVIVLKPIKAALTDGDQIYGIITGSGINQDGKTSGITAPSAPSQTDLERRVYTKYDINPETIGYVEAHGTGTELGDPIEVQALTEAFRTYTDKRQFCALGSVKTNIGHTMAASGIAGLIKALLCLQYKSLVPSLHFEKANPHIDFENSPFYVNTRLKDWPTISGYLRRAAVSSFGMSGSNAHVVLEEYGEKEVRGQGSGVRGEPQLIVLSAKNEERLKAYAESILKFLEIEDREPATQTAGKSKIENRKSKIQDIAFTLQVGRKAMDERLAVVASTLNDVKQTLSLYVQGDSEIEGFCRGNAKSREQAAPSDTDGMPPLSSASHPEFVSSTPESRKHYLDRLAKWWVTGKEVDWRTLYTADQPRRITLPTYPFAENRYWIPDNGKAGDKNPVSNGGGGRLHPLLDRNTSTLKEQRFTKRLTGQEYVLTDHVVAKQKIFPGVAYLEMACLAGENAGEREIEKITHMVWARPITVSDSAVDAHVSIFPEDEDTAAFEIHSEEKDSQRLLHAQGKLVYRTRSPRAGNVDPINIESIISRCSEMKDIEACYDLFKASGVDYGPGFRVLHKLYGNEKEALSRIVLPESLQPGFHDYVFHPSLMDGALQTVIGIKDRDSSKRPHVPFTLEALIRLKPLPMHCYAHAFCAGASKETGIRKYHIDILDETGETSVRMINFSVRVLEPSEAKPSPLYFQTVWKMSTPKDLAGAQHPTGPILLFDTGVDRRQRLQERFNTEIVLVKSGKDYQVSDKQTYSIRPGDYSHYHQLINALSRQGEFPKQIIHLWSQASYENKKTDLSHQLEHSLYSVFHLSRALMELNPDDSIQILYLYREAPGKPQPQYAALSGFAETVRLENPKLKMKTIALSDWNRLADAISTECQAFDDVHIRYRNGKREVSRLKEFEVGPGAESPLPLMEKGVYLLTGGVGGLGLVFADHFAQRLKARLVLNGRSALSDQQSESIKRMNQTGAEVVYLRADVSQREEVKSLIAETKSRFGEINGIIHLAGVRKDALILKKNAQDMASVLAPKVYGTIWLDEATRSEPLDFFVLFSSTSALTGSMGQSDYSYANRFLDEYALFREQLRSEKKRIGQTLSINWPLWQAGGMQVDDQTVKLAAKTMGMTPLHFSSGLEVFIKGLASGHNRFMVIEGYPSKIRRALGIGFSQDHPSESRRQDPEILKYLKRDLFGLISEMLKVDKQDIDPDDHFSEYGFDSIGFTELANRINDKYRLDITPARFFEFPSVSAFSDSLCNAYEDQLGDYYQERLKPAVYRHTRKIGATAGNAHRPENRFQVPVQTRRDPDRFNDLQIAVIGMSGMLPQSENLEVFWQHLISGNHLITEVPGDRWDWKSYHGDPEAEGNKTQVKWGGFIPHVDKFDALFFGISPREAELMDPQQRLFLQTVWKTIEDAGYRALDFSGTDTGLFVGVASHDYNELLKASVREIQVHASTGMAHAILANRISYLLNLHGPSEAIDTACSSSLVAIHHAVQAIHNGSCEMALAGGVNVMLTPTMTIAFDKAGMLSREGSCKVFDKRADGYVRGEGVGAILLKPLSAAEADGDHIYAVIRSAAENHGGHAASLTAPNPSAQAQLLIKAYEKAGIGPETVSYIETHGTGTELGDPIEINGLKNAFNLLYERSGTSLPVKPYCALGSVKTNIGHLETAAGIASVMKVLLAMRHKRLPANLHFKELNPYIQLEGSPFYILTECQNWVSLKDAGGNPVPRRAGVSSFGIGGANAHVVLEEYEEEVRGEGSGVRGGNSKLKAQSSKLKVEPQLFVLSAKNVDRLREYAKDMADFVEHQESSIENRASKIEDIAYTLQVGREAMEERLAVVVSDIHELKPLLVQFIGGRKDAALYHGNVRESKRRSEALVDGEEGMAFIQSLTRKGKLGKLAQLWIGGVDIDWKLLHQNRIHKRISLPTYPFEKERYWIPVQETTSDSKPVESEEGRVFYGIDWQRSEVDDRAPISLPKGPVLLFDSDDKIQTAIQEKTGNPVILVTSGNRYEMTNDQTVSIRPGLLSDYRKLITDQQQQNRMPRSVIHLWSGDRFSGDETALNGQLKKSVYSVFNIAKVLMEAKAPGSVQLLYIYEQPPDEPQPQYEAMGGLLRSIRLENPGFGFKSVAIPDRTRILEVLFTELQDPNEGEIRYDGLHRWVKNLKTFDPASSTDPILFLKEGGVYLITGGAGGLGMILARYFAGQTKCKLILTGRSVLGKEQSLGIRALNDSGAEVVFIRADGSNHQETKALVREIRSRYGEINGIVHAAGVIRDAYVIEKDPREMTSVLAPKVSGLVHLDGLTQNEPLDFFVMFSSVAAVTGNAGQADYAYANSFMDSFALLREKLGREGKRSGRTVSINWPIWQDGGMKIAKETLDRLTLRTGLKPLSISEGIEAFKKITFESDRSQCIAAYGYKERIRNYFDSALSLKFTEEEGSRPATDSRSLYRQTERFLKKMMAELLKLSTRKIDSGRSLEEYGIDSIIVNRFNDRMAEMLGPLPKTLLFEYQTLRDLTGYFIRNYSSRLERLFAKKEELSERGIETPPAALPPVKQSAKSFSARPPIHHFSSGEEEIAIIGISGRYPSALNLEEYWQNLKEGKDCISEIPKSRFEYRPYYHPDPEMSSEGKIYCKWGGFLEDAETFDPLFFNISPKEAEITDPQERLFLETAWSTLEDAGYTRDGLKDCRVGTFVGVTTNTYLLWGPDIWRSGDIKSIPASLPWSVANRVSYFFNFQGPSLPVDTACSSALSAIHLACESLRKGECDLALTGGVNLYLHPAKYVQLCQSRMLSPSGRCHTFGIDGDGFVPGEGVGAALLKPLNRAMSDGDHIYAVIKGSAVNHGGKTTGYTVPNPSAQAALISETLEKTGVDPRTISFVEAHGTGTELGDPIEIRGLTKAFRRHTEDRQFCSIGSVKSNIGHSEAAAGIAGIHKILLQMKFGRLVPSLHAETLNPNINFKDSPFYVQHELSEWKSHYPRRAAISSFGAGGSNAHIILEEYQEKEFGVQRSGFRVEPQLIVLSAKNEDRLKEYVGRMIRFLDSTLNSERLTLNLYDIAYTLQVGREAMEERLALVISDVKELGGKLRRYISGDSDIEDAYAGNIKRNEAVFEQILEGETGDTFLRMAVERKEYGKIARLWVAGAEIDWRFLHQHSKPNRISLPTYPFARNRYWIPERLAGERKGLKIGSGNGLHPLLDANTSTLKEQKFLKKLTGHEFYLTDHVIGDQKTFPGVAYLEMARAAGEYATEHAVRTLTNIVWVQPISVSEPGQDVSVILHHHPKGEKIGFEVITMGVGEQKRVHAQGNICFEDGGNIEVPFVDLKSLRGRFTQRKSGAECYQAYGDAGMHYGAGFRAIQELYVNQTEALSRLVLPASVRKGFTDFALHPSLMDGALQTIMGLAGEATAAVPFVPFNLGEVVSFLPLTETCYAHAVLTEASDRSANPRYSVDILSETGQVLVRLKAFYVRAFDPSGEKVHAKPKRILRDTGNDRQQGLVNRLGGELSAMVSEILKIDGHDVNPNDNISEYGFDSIGFTDFANRINDAYGLEITPAIFFDHASIADLIRFLTTDYPQRFAAYDQRNGSSEPSIERPPATDTLDIPFEAAHRFFPAAARRIQEKDLTQAPVAIVGMSAVMPNSPDADYFWKHLEAGADLISEVPKERWDWRQNAGGSGAEADTAAFKWGGFISDADMFDCLFFGISPREAELMDPQQRLFLQVVWKTIEDAGYRASNLAGTATGVFVGVASHDYEELLNRQLIDSHAATGMAHSILANRISYLLDLHGPSEPIDTACSSSLIAIHRAFEAIVGGVCEMAIAGGVNLMLSPTATIAFGKAGMLSNDGRCKTFDKSADGYVRGEGAGAILMKPLDAALRSGDHIYAVIRSTAVNHGGRAPSLTAPNSKAQSQLLIDAYEKAGIEPDTVGYIETHGTGTPLGDPVEVNGLKHAFDALYRSNGKSLPKSAHCGLGSVKTNIGHLETAAGIASIVKVLLALKHRKIPANAHFRESNPYIQLEGSPFYIVTECIDWESLKDAGGKSLPRRAGVSSFGYGGANAHVVLEEYREKEVRGQGSGVRGEPQLILLSAKNEDRLREYAKRMADFIEIQNPKSKIENLSVADIAYTLQVGREAMEDRLAMVVSDPAELREKLNRFVRGESPREGVFSGTARKGAPSLMLEDEEGREYLRSLFQKKRLEKLGQLWVSGVPIDWSRLHEDGKYRRVPLPTYPFARERYWIPEADGKRDGMGGFREKLHPLVERNTSTLSEQKFSTRLSGREFYLSEHVILDQKVLPGVAYLELARAAGELSDRRPVRALKNVVWMKPIVVSEHPVDVHIGLHPKEENVEFTVFTADENDRRQRHAQGILIFEDPAEQPPVEAVIDIDAVRKRCPKKLTKSEFYAPFKGVGFDLGESFKVVEEIRGSDIDALAVIHLPPNRKTGYRDFFLHPSVMDGALQSTIGLIFETFQSPGLPFSLGRLEVLRPMTGHRYFAHARAAETTAPDSEVKRYDILIADEFGQVVVSIKDFVGRPLQQKGSEGVYFRPVWQPADISLPEAAPAGPVLLFDLDESRRKAFEGQLKTRVIPVYPGERYAVRSDGAYSLRPGNFEDYRKLLASLNQLDRMPRHILHAWSQAPFSAEVSRLDAQLEKGFYSMFHLSRALLELKPSETQILFFYLETADTAQPQYAALSGFGRSIHLETSRLRVKTVALTDMMDALNAARVEFSATDGPEVSYRSGRRWIRRLRTFTPGEPDAASMLREGGVYLITGGSGGLGRIVAAHLLSRVKARVILTGRSRQDPERSAHIEALGALGGEICYVQADVTRRDHVAALISTVKDRFGKINGVIHGAGVIRDAFLGNKDLKAARAVLGPKVTGTVYLDEATRSESIDFFVLFSSIAALTGNIGQCDYAFANGFMDHFAQWREARRIDGTRSGKTIAVNWPLWQGGGMRVDGETEKWMSRTLGADPLKSEAGLAALFTGLGAADSQFAFVQGDPEKIRKALMPDTDPHPADETSEKPTPPGGGSLIKKVQTELLPMAAAVVKVDPGIIKAEENFSRYGFESLTFTEFSNRINQKYRLEITPTLFFEYPSLYRFSRFLAETYPQALLKYHGEKGRTPFPASALRALQVEREETEGAGSRNRFDHKRASGGRRQAVPDRDPSTQAPVAIIGMSGRMPQSKNPEQFWEHLWEGKDLIREVPQDRWDWRAIYGDPIREPGKTWAKWGGFMPAVDRFDCRFFNIPPREAALMDPQHRLFLQTVWETVEDAGYRASDLAGTRTGLYVGVATNDYYELMLRAGIPLPSYMAAFHSMLANQISYLMDLRGPSEPIDTTCSSSLVAIHHAMAAIRSRQCEMALAGGVNAILSPTVTTACSKAGMLAADGRCKTFDEGADGYVRGEGVGAVLLKPLDRAEADGDHIYAVVLGTAENHGGHAASLTAPNPAAQAELLVQVYEEAGVSPDTVGYIESHGTGTSLGDPIEINGLKDAFARLYEAREESVPQHPHCGLGSVKTNIGHLETAAGIIGVIKVLLALKHRRLPASLHLKKMNPYIQLEGSPFYIVDKRMAWEPLKDRQGNPVPRRAGVSSFGIGGVNAHVVLEEYGEKEVRGQGSAFGPEELRPRGGFRGEAQLIVLSAKNEDRLKAYAKAMVDYIDSIVKEEIQNPKSKIENIAYTLQVGREPMTERLAAVVSTVEEMGDRLVRFSSGETDIPDFFRGSARGVGRGAETLAEEEEGRAMIAGMMRKGKIKKLARLWVSGWTIDFRQLHQTGGRKKRLSLPPYPFAEERHWFSEKKGVSAVPSETVRPLADSAPLETHPEHRFSGRFFIPGWEPVSTELPEASTADPKAESGNVLILHNPEDEKMATEISRIYSQERVYFIRLGEKTRRISDRLWETDCNDAAALKGCLAHIPALDRIFHLGGIEHRAFDPKDRPAFKESRKRGTLTLFRLVKCLDASGADQRPIQIRIVTHSVHPAASADAVRPGSAGLYGLARTVANEYPRFGVQSIDIDFIDVDDPVEKERIHRFLQDLAASRMDHLGDEIACRGERLYTRRLQPVRLAPKDGICLRQKGIYLIAGGAGRIGFELSLRLARDAAARTVWIGRREPDAEIRNRMERIEGAGGKVLYLQADVASAADMKKAVEAATSRFGNIQGAFHCATQADIKMLRDMDEQTFLSAMKPKSEGSIALFRSLESEPLDFIMFFSSSQSFIGDRGLGHYAAACAFQDGLAHYLRQTATIPVVSVNWGLWKTEIGDASVHGKAVIDALGFDPIEPDEAMAAAWRILDHGISQVMFLKAEDRLYRRIGIKDPTPKLRYPERMPQTLSKLSDRLQIPPLSALRIKAHRKAFGELETIGRFRLLNAFNRMGILKKEGDAHAVADLRSGLGITPSHDQLFMELLNILKRAAFVEISGDTIVAAATIADPEGLRDPDAMEKWQADLVSRFPEISPYADLLDACIRRYPEILTGQLPATDVLFPDGSLDPVEHVYRDNETADHFNRQTARIVRAYLEGRETLPERDEKIRILEVGAGTGGTSRSVLSEVHSFGHRVEYVYTDVSRRFIRHGKDRFRQYPFLQFGLLNIAEDPLSQGYQPDRYDMVIAANVIHATADLRNTLRHIKSLLKTNGWLVFNEVTAPLEFGTMTFGLLEGWWMFEDHACRMPGTPLLSVPLWQKLLETEGFRHTAYFGLSGRHGDESDQHILVAESDGIVGESLGEEIGSALRSPDRDSVMMAAKTPAAVSSAGDRSATVRERIKECLASVLELDLEEFEAETPFSEFGVDSILALEIINQINDALSVRLRSTDLFNYATIAHLTDHIVNAFKPDPAPPASAPATTRAGRLSAEDPVPVVAPGDIRAPGSLDIAVIGMAGRFPDAEDVHGFWKNLSQGRDSISTFPESRPPHRPSGDPESDPGRSPYRWGGFLADIDCFDPGFFNMPPKEAELTDPQQRLFLQEAWHALEDAGYSPGLLKGRKCGVFAGYNVIEYQNTLLRFDAPLDAHSFTGNMASVLAARISYFLDLKGPSIAVNTACSSSLVAVHLACESIRSGTSDMALAGGVMVMTSGHFHEFGSRLGMLSPDGRCKTFDSRADGFVPGEGVGVVVLKPLDAAIRGGDHIYGVIIGSGINQDGKTSGITAPSAVSQAALEKEVYRTHGIHPETISYVEAHGTGTELGDPIEVQALTEAFRELTDKKRFCALGSVKTNIGHTTAAAGVAGLIKALLCLKHGKLVPSLHFVSENRHFSLRNGPFYVNKELVDWNTEPGMPKRAAVSAFGLSGTNAHLVVEEYGEKEVRGQGSAFGPEELRPRGGFRGERQLIVLSAKNEDRLKAYAAKMIEFISNIENRKLKIEDIAYTLQIGRAEWEERVALVISDAGELKEMLKAFVNGTGNRETMFRGNTRKDRQRLDDLQKGKGMDEVMAAAVEAGDIVKIAALWTIGATVDWMRFHLHPSDVKPKRVSLPGYPFSKERYWVSMPTPSRENNANRAFQGGNRIDAGVFEELRSLSQGRSSAEDVHRLIREKLQTT